ncbi:MAG TPA: DNA repair protein RecN [Cytophagales bacterium]|nr:DNA repair protein RecN [Cytophagales bacterium]
MLSKLFIKNYALIKSLEISLSEGLNIITGETGAGKSILLGALGLLMGNRADSKSLYDENEKCIVEGEFDISGYGLKELFEEESLDYEANCLIRREISIGGKSRAFINDTPVNLDTLKTISARLIDIHSQHDTLLLGSANYQLDIIDILCGNASLKKDFSEAYKTYKKSEEVYKNIIQESASFKKEYDFDKFLFDELEKAKLESGEQDSLETELNINEHAEEVKIKLSEITFLMNSADQSVLSGLYSVSNLISSLSKFSEKYNSLKIRIESAVIELKDISGEIESEAETIHYDPQKIEKIKDRLGLIYTLQKKHNVKSVDELIQIESALQLKLEKILNLDEEIESALKKKEETYQKALVLAESLSSSRRNIVREMDEMLIDLLRSLGMPNASLKVTHSSSAMNSSGIDEMRILFSANKGSNPQELKNVASGGEFSRLMLALKYIIADKIALPTIIFDEIDTGVSGEISIKMGKMMKEMARNHQVFAITHLPQIASQGASQYFVYKDDSADRTISNIRQLNEEERIVEIAKMIGGEQPSAIAISNAKELLGVN